MRDFLWKNKIHILIWVAMLAYLLGAHTLYEKYILAGTAGSPAEISEAIPDSTGKIKFAFDCISNLQNGFTD